MRYRLTKANLSERVGSLLGKAINTIIEDVDKTQNLKLKINALMTLGKTMTKLADKYRVEALTIEHGKERIEKAREVMEDALEETYNCYYDNPRDAIDGLIESCGEWGKLSEALAYLEYVEDTEEEEAQ